MLAQANPAPIYSHFNVYTIFSDKHKFYLDGKLGGTREFMKIEMPGVTISSQTGVSYGEPLYTGSSTVGPNTMLNILNIKLDI